MLSKHGPRAPILKHLCTLCPVSLSSLHTHCSVQQHYSNILASVETSMFVFSLLPLLSPPMLTALDRSEQPPRRSQVIDIDQELRCESTTCTNSAPFCSPQLTTMARHNMKLVQALALASSVLAMHTGSDTWYAFLFTCPASHYTLLTLSPAASTSRPTAVLAAASASSRTGKIASAKPTSRCRKASTAFMPAA